MHLIWQTPDLNKFKVYIFMQSFLSMRLLVSILFLPLYVSALAQNPAPKLVVFTPLKMVLENVPTRFAAAFLPQNSLEVVLYELDGQAIPDSGGYAVARWKPRPENRKRVQGGYDKCWYSLRVYYKTPGGSTRMLERTDTLLMRRPELVFPTCRYSILYKNCANNLHITCPDLGEEYKPAFSYSGGTLEQHPWDLHLVRVSPTANFMDINVFSYVFEDTVFLGREQFRAIDPPPPSFEYYVKKPELLRRGGKVFVNDTLNVRLIPTGRKNFVN